MKNLTDLLNDMQNARKALEKFQTQAPRMIGVEAVKVVKQNFEKQGYDSGNGFIRWSPRSPATNKSYDRGKTSKSRYRVGKNATYKGSVFSSQKPLLEQTMNLYNSIDYKARQRSVFVGSNTTIIPYAKIHNEGGRGIPQRQYQPLPNQPANKKMRDIIGKKIKMEQDRAMRMFRK